MKAKRMSNHPWGAYGVFRKGSGKAAVIDHQKDPNNKPQPVDESLYHKPEPVNGDHAAE